VFSMCQGTRANGILAQYEAQGLLIINRVKRGDVHATQSGDVVKVQGALEYEAILANFRRRGITCAAVEPHIEGEVVKFYGVVNSPFFSFYCEQNPDCIPAGFRAARPAIETIIREVGLEIYGGDAVMTRDGRVVVVDVND
jgi:hypothetical protein